MGAVYKARAADGTVVAIKLLAGELNENEVQLRRFYQEAEIAMRLDHPNMVRALAVGEDHGRHYFAMEYVDGVSLGTRLKREGYLKEKDAVRIIIDVARALHKAHKEGLVHRDVKPDNILLTSDNTAKLADMGLVKQLESDLNLTRTGRGLGTPHFMAPEQFRDAKNADARCDVYSLGATLYMMVTGQLPFKGNGPLETFMKKSSNSYTAPEELNPRLSDKTVAAIKMAMDAEPGNRPASAKEFAEILVGHTKPRLPDDVVTPKDVWYVIYYDNHGHKQKVKGTSAAIEQQVRRGRLNSSACASQSKRGPFRPLTDFPQFAPLFMQKRSNNNHGTPVPATSDTHADAIDPTRVVHSSSFRKLADPKMLGNLRGEAWVWGVAAFAGVMLTAVVAWLLLR